MKVVFQSYAFYPSVGGIESSAQTFIREFTRAGCEIRVHTMTSLGAHPEIAGTPVRRNPSLRQIIHDFNWADVIYQHNPSLRLSWPAIASHTPQVVSIRTWIRRSKNNRISLVDHLKRYYVSRQTVISNSRATADDLDMPSTVIENTYDDATFVNTNHTNRSGLIFVGRLVSDKGCITAIEAIAKIRQAGHLMTLQIVGHGPDENALKQTCTEWNLDSLVTFHGHQAPAQVAQLLNSAAYHVIPSIWAEPFGIVALEGIACGCIPIATNHGGLVDAVGHCGSLFPPGDADALVQTIIELESSPAKQESYRQHHSQHLQTHSPSYVAEAYLDQFKKATARDQHSLGNT